MSKLALPPLSGVSPAAQSAFRAIAAWANAMEEQISGTTQIITKVASSSATQAEVTAQVKKAVASVVKEPVRSTKELVVDILQNMGNEPPIDMNAPVLFQARGRDASNNYFLGIGAGGLLGGFVPIGSSTRRDSFGISTKDGSFFFGTEDPANTTDPAHRQIVFDTAHNAIVFGSSIKIRRSNGDEETLETVASRGYSHADLENDLAAGVSSVIAGAGGNFVLEASADGGYVLMRHKDLQYTGGSAYSGTLRTALGITSNGIFMGYQSKTTGAFTPTVSIDGTTGNATFLGTIAANSVLSSSATVDGMSLATIKGNASLGSSAYSSLSSKLDANAANVMNTGFYLKTPNYDSTAANTGGLAIYNGGILGRKRNKTNTGWDVTFVVDANGNATFKGDISGASGTFAGDINTSGQILATGVTNSGTGISASIVGSSLVADVGVFGQGNKFGVYGTGATGVGGRSVSGIGVEGGGGTGVYGIGHNYGVYATTVSGIALHVHGRMEITDPTRVENLNADRLDDYHASSFLIVNGSTSVWGGGGTLYRIPIKIGNTTYYFMCQTS